MPAIIVWLDLRSIEAQGSAALASTMVGVNNALSAYSAKQILHTYPSANGRAGWGAVGYRIENVPADPSGFGLARDILRDFYRAIPPDAQYGWSFDARDMGLGIQSYPWMKRSVNQDSPLYNDPEQRRRRQQAFDTVDKSLRHGFDTVEDGEVMEGSP